MRNFYTYKHTNILADDKYTKIYIFCKHEDVKKIENYKTSPTSLKGEWTPSGDKTYIHINEKQ